VQSAAVRGFCILLGEYLSDACMVNRGDGSTTGGPDRTILYGLQRPPINGQDTVLRCSADTSFDELAPTLMPFYATNALDSLRVSCDPANTALLEILAKIDGLGEKISTETAEGFASIDQAREFYNVVGPEALADNNNTQCLEQFPLVGQFVSLYFPMGHIKSTRQQDQAFVDFFSCSEKWLRVHNGTTHQQQMRLP
jgi:hypothetical protein